MAVQTIQCCLPLMLLAALTHAACLDVVRTWIVAEIGWVLRLRAWSILVGAARSRLALLTRRALFRLVAERLALLILLLRIVRLICHTQSFREGLSGQSSPASQVAEIGPESPC